MADQALGTKHLEFLQAAVTRLAGNSFMIKGWSLTLATAVAGFAVKDGENAVALVGIVPVALLWWMDAYYLSLEQAFRNLFKEAKDKVLSGAVPTLEMTPMLTALSVARTALRPSVVLIHLPAQAVLLSAGLLSS